MEDDSIDIFESILKMWDKKWMILIITGVITVAGAGAVTLWPKTYLSSATLLVIPPKISSELSPSALTLKSYQKLAETPAILKNIIDQLKLKDRHGNPEIVERIASKVSTEIPKALLTGKPLSTGLMTLFARGNEPEKTTNIVNAWAEILAESSRNIRKSEVEAVTRLIDTQYSATRKKLNLINDQIKSLKQKTDFSALTQEILSKRTKLFMYKRKVMAIDMILKEKALPGHLTNQAKFDISVKSKPISDATIADLQGLLEQYLESVYERYRESEILTYTAGNFLNSGSAQTASSLKSAKHLDFLPEYKTTLSIDPRTTTPRLKDLYRSEVLRLENTLSALNVEYQNQTQKLEDLDREKKVLLGLFNTLAKKSEQAQALKTEKTSDIRFIARAPIPHEPISPNHFMVTLISFALGFTLSIFIAFFKVHMEQRPLLASEK